MIQGRRLRVAIAAAAAALMAALGGGTVLVLDRMRDTAEAAARDTVERSARVVHASLNRNLMAVDGLLAAVPAILGALPRDAAGRPAGHPQGETVEGLLHSLIVQNLLFRDLVLIGADGRLIASATRRARAAGLPVPARVAPATAEGVAIEGPLRSAADGSWTILLARDVVLPGHGRVMAVAELATSQLTQLLGAEDAARGLRLAIRRGDGLLLAAAPPDEAGIGRQPPIAQAEPPPDGVARIMPSRSSGAAEIRADRPIAYGDLYVSASQDVAAALAAWRADRAWLVAGMVGFSLLLGGFALAVNLAIRQRERGEAERMAARRVLENALAALPDGFVMFDADDRLVVCNQRYRDLYAVSAPFIRPGVAFAELIREGAKRGQYPQAGPDIEAFVQAVQAWHRGDNPPMERLLPDGRWLLVTERRTPDGGTVGIRTDITALKTAMAELSTARDAAARATEAKSRFLARMSHELRTPLAGIVGLAELLEQDVALSGTARAQAGTLALAARHLLAVANDVLDLARIETATLVLQPAPAMLAPLLDSCVTMMRAAAAERGASLVLSVDPALPETILADGTRLRQVVLNLLSNAVKFSPAGGRVTVRALAQPPADAAAPPRLRIEVRDEGPGVPVSQRSAIFRDFVQIEQTGTPEGAGLGLAIVAHIVERMEGRIGCTANDEARLGRGALFWVDLPIAAVDAPQRAPDALSLAPAAVPLRILVADDVQANRMVAQALLESAGHVVDVVPDGAAAVAAMAASQGGTGPAYDAVLMDVMMPTMNGAEATRRIRALPGRAGTVPIVALTASVFPEDLAGVMAAGADAHVLKPFDRDALLARLAVLTAAVADPPGEAAGPGAADAAATPLVLRPASGGLAIPGVDEATAQRLLPDILRDIRAARDDLAGAAESDAPLLAALAHRLAGAAATLGAERLADAARGLETAARRGPAEQIGRQRALVLGLAAETLVALEARATPKAGLAA